MTTAAEVANGMLVWLMERWDTNWWWATIALVFGTLAGFKGIFDRYGEFAGAVSQSRWGFFYLGIRGLIPTGAFIGLYNVKYFDSWLPVWAAVTGAGVEAVLRLGFLWKQKQAPGGGQGAEDLLVGPFQLLTWFQDYCLDRARDVYQTKATDVAAAAILQVETAVDGATFVELVARVETRVDAFDGAIALKLKERVTNLKQEYAAEPQPPAANLDRKYCIKLGYAVRILIKDKGMKQLFAAEAKIQS